MLPIPMEALTVLNFPDPYGVLNLPYELLIDVDNPEHIKLVNTAYRRMVRYWHPDKIARYGFPKDLNTQILVALTWARATLVSNDHYRAQHEFLEGWQELFYMTELHCGFRIPNGTWPGFWPASLQPIGRHTAKDNGWYFNIWSFWRSLRRFTSGGSTTW